MLKFFFIFNILTFNVSFGSTCSISSDPLVSATVFNGITSAVTASATTVRLSWTHSAQAVVYHIFNTTSGTPVFVGSIKAPATAYVITGLTANTNYLFRVKLIDSEGKIDSNTNDFSVTTDSFTPTALGNLKLWLKIDSFLSSDDEALVSSWSDQSGSLNHFTQATSTYQPRVFKNKQDNLPAIGFDGSDDHLSCANNILSSNNGMTFFAVLKSFSNRSVAFVYDFGFYAGTSYGFAYDINSYGINTPNSHGGVSGLNSGVHATGASDFSLFTGQIIFNSAQESRLNGAAAAGISEAITTTVLNGATITTGNKPRLANQSKALDIDRNFNGYIMEILLYDISLSATDRELVQCYLGKKYNITLGHGC